MRFVYAKRTNGASAQNLFEFGADHAGHADKSRVVGMAVIDQRVLVGLFCHGKAFLSFRVQIVLRAGKDQDGQIGARCADGFEKSSCVAARCAAEGTLWS